VISSLVCAAVENPASNHNTARPATRLRLA